MRACFFLLACCFSFSALALDKDIFGAEILETQRANALAEIGRTRAKIVAITVRRDAIPQGSREHIERTLSELLQSYEATLKRYKFTEAELTQSDAEYKAEQAAIEEMKLQQLLKQKALDIQVHEQIKAARESARKAEDANATGAKESKQKP